jgi:hypothetical protein
MKLRTSLAVCGVVLAACQAPAATSSLQAAVTATQDAEASPSASPTVPAEPTPSPTASATPAPVVSAAFPPGSLARVAVDTLLLREEPGSNTMVMARIPGGDVVYLSGLPPFEREADGYTWRHVWYIPGFDEWPSHPGGAFEDGWVAIGEGSTPFLTPVQPDCPTGPETLGVDDLAAMLPYTVVDCVGDRELTLKGKVITGFGGYMVGEFEPFWLAAPHSFAGVITSAGHTYSYLLQSDGTGLTDGQRIQITGHFNDPAARDCHVAVGDPPVAEPDSLARMWCQTRFVATDIKVL